MEVEAGPSSGIRPTRAAKGRRKNHAKGSRSRGARELKLKSDADELKQLEIQCNERLEGNGKEVYKRFDELPLSSKTRSGLKKASFFEMTDIQAKSLPLSLTGKDILGAARTGSGKTLAFLLPVLERLYRLKWGSSDGLGALVLSPTRELAIQIFEVLRKIGSHHSLSAGLIIGGKDVKVEKDRLSRMNILVATPGRLLQHMDQTTGFDTSNVQILVLDEADRCLDMGFENTLDAILDNIPKGSRQTLLFSATQTKKVKDLARLNLSSPEYVAVNEEGSGKGGAIPDTLQQHYMVVPLEQKLSLLFSFIRTHLKCKVLVFFSSCRQVQFAYETFRRMRPGTSLLSLHGKQKQVKRLQIFNDFTKMPNATLFATDIAARGLDFPKIDWVIQVDTPEDVDTYIHRVGRTARYTSKGNSLLFLLPSEEEGFIKRMKGKSIEAELIKPKQSKVQDISNQLQSFLFQDAELKYLGQKAFVSYIRSIHLQSDKSIFDVAALPLNTYAESLGLAGAPKVKFVKEAQAAKKKAEKISEASRKEQGKAKTKYDRMFERKNQGVLSEHYKDLIEEGNSIASDDIIDDEEKEETTLMDPDGLPRTNGHIIHTPARDEEDDFLTLKRANHTLDDGEEEEAINLESHLSKRKLRMGQSKKAAAAAGMRGQGEKVLFDDDGMARKVYEVENEESFKRNGNAKLEANRFIEMEREKLQERDVIDKERMREKKREKRQREKEREKEKRGEGKKNDQREGVTLVPIDDDRQDGYETPEFDLNEESEEEDRPQKKSRYTTNLQQEEDLALRLLEE